MAKQSPVQDQTMILKNLAKLTRPLKKLGLKYSYICGSFNTPFFNKNSDLNIVMVWKEMLLPLDRDQILSEVAKTFNCKFIWKFLDQNLKNPKDAINLQNFRKVEFLHFTLEDFKNFSSQLNNPEQFESHYYSIKNRIPLIENTELDAFMDFQLPQKINSEELLQNYLKNVLNQNKIVLTEITHMIFKMAFIKTLKAIPTNKYWEKSLHKISLSPELKKMLSQILKIKNAHNLKNWLQRNKLKLVHELI